MESLITRICTARHTLQWSRQGGWRFWARGTRGRSRQTYVQFWWEKLKKRLLGRPRIDGSKILKRSLRNSKERHGMDSSGSRQGKVVDSCGKHSNELNEAILFLWNLSVVCSFNGIQHFGSRIFIRDPPNFVLAYTRRRKQSRLPKHSIPLK